MKLSLDKYIDVAVEKWAFLSRVFSHSTFFQISLQHQVDNMRALNNFGNSIRKV